MKRSLNATCGYQWKLLDPNPHPVLAAVCITSVDNMERYEIDEENSIQNNGGYFMVDIQ